jgi:hypothetical protein
LAGGVDTQSPVTLEGGAVTVAFHPSVDRAERIAAATASPEATPFAFCGPLRIIARMESWSPSVCAAPVGNNAVITAWAAALAAASREALAGTVLGTR